VVRSGRAPCGERTALSWDFGALRGQNLTRCHAYGLRGPARRFHALRACARPSGADALLRRRPSLRLPIPFRGLSHHPRTVPGSRRIRASDDASFPGLSCPTTHARSADPSSTGRPAPQRATSEVWVPPSRRPPSILRKPCGLRASTGFHLRGVLLDPVGLPLGRPCPPAVARVDSPRPYRSVRTRPASGPCSRLELVLRSSPCGPDASMPPWRSSLQSVLPHRPCERFMDSRPLPHHALGGMTSRPACVTRSCETVRSAGPSRGCQLSWDLPPCNRRGITEDRSGRRAY